MLGCTGKRMVHPCRLMDKYFSVYTMNVQVHEARPIFPISVFTPE